MLSVTMLHLEVDEELKGLSLYFSFCYGLDFKTLLKSCLHTGLNQAKVFGHQKENLSELLYIEGTYHS